MTRKHADGGKKRRKDLDYCDRRQPLTPSRHEDENKIVVEATCNSTIGVFSFPVAQRRGSK
jgi:hypothetical protein